MTAMFLMLAAVSMLALAAFCAGAETAFLSVSRERILHLSRAGGRKAKIVQSALSDMPRTLTTLLIGNNLAAVAYSSASAALAIELLGTARIGRLVWTVASALVVLYASEFMPKMLCVARPLKWCLGLAKPYRILSAALSPIIVVVVRVTSVFVPRREQKYRLTGNDLMRILRDRKDGVVISDFESALIGRIVACRAAKKPVTPETLLSAVRDSPVV